MSNRITRYSFLFIALYFVFVGGAVYYDLLLSLRVFHHWAVTFLLGGWLLLKLRPNRDTSGLPSTPLNTPLFVLVGVWFAAAFFSIDQRMALENTWFLIQHTLIFFVLVDLLQQGRARMVMETQFLIGVVIVMISAMELASWYFGLLTTSVGWADVGLIPGQLPPRLAWAMNSTNWLGGYVAPLTLFVGVWAYTTGRKDARRALYILTGLLFTVLLFTQTRGGYLSFAAGISAFTAMRIAQTANLRQRLTPRTLLALGAVAAFVIGTFAVVIGVSQSRNSGDSIRIDMYRSAVEMTVDYPVLGVGPGIFGRAYREYRTPELARDRLGAAHNAYLGIASESGVIGLMVNAWLGLALLGAWWATWRRAETRGEKLRLEATIAALLGVAAHSMVDIFTQTPNVILIVLLVAYSITGETQARISERRPGQRWPAVAGVVVLAAYMVWFVFVDRSQGHYEDSLRLAQGQSAISAAQNAHDGDPALNLYPLQVAYLIGAGVEDAALTNEADPAAIDAAITQYQSALVLEPTWDTGWLNLAALYEMQGAIQAAYEAVNRAYAINPLTSAVLHRARLAETLDTLPEAEIVDLYAEAIGRSPHLPLADYWTATPLREQSLMRLLNDQPRDIQYRVWRVHNPERAAALILETPQSAAEYWIAGEAAYQAGNRLEAAELFSKAIAQDGEDGDYYASRARATLDTDPAAARRDLTLAQLYGTRAEYPNAIEAQLENDPDIVRELLVRALPGRVVDYAFTAVLYGDRISGWDVMGTMRYPGPGRAAMQPWYTLAATEEINGDILGAIEIYEAILDYAPDEREAQDRLSALRE